MFTLCVFLGALGIYLFHEGVYLPVIVSTAVFVFVGVYLVGMHRRSRVGPLTILFFVVYALPFIHIVPYIWFDFDADTPVVLWGLLANPYMLDKATIELMSMIGAVGAIGFAAGAALMRGTVRVGLLSERIVRYRANHKTQSIPVFLAWIAIAVALTWISAPSNTLFTAAYTESQSIEAAWNFSSAWMLSYAFLAFAVADSIFEQSAVLAALKWRIVLGAMLLMVVWFQLLRGDRESLPFILAALLMYYSWGRGLVGVSGSRVKLNRPAILLSLCGVFVAAQLVGAARFLLVGAESISDVIRILRDLASEGVIRFDNVITGTWSAVLLTPLSVAGDYINHTLPLKHGQTYLDLLGSTMPGFVASWIGYTRPIDALHGPAWEMTYGMGGTHAVVLPFMNFRMTGVFTVMALFSFVFARIERASVDHLSVSRLALLGIVAMALPHWLWYGEKNIMNALIIWLVLSVLYRARLMSRPAPFLRVSYQPSESVT